MSDFKTQNPSAEDWAGARGDKWHAALDLLEATLAPVDQPLIDALSLAAGMRVADIGCGGGATTIAIAGAAPEASRVTGFDISATLINAARSKTPGQPSAIDFIHGDATKAPLPDRLFDRLTSRFGVMFFNDPDAAFGRLRQWLAPTGRFAFAVWGPPSENPWMMAIREAADGVVDLPTPDPDAPGPYRYAEIDGFYTLLRAAGFRNVDAAAWRGFLPVAGGVPANDAADFALSSFGPGEFVKEAGDEAFAAVHARLAEIYRAHEGDSGVHMPAFAWIVTGDRGD